MIGHIANQKVESITFKFWLSSMLSKQCLNSCTALNEEFTYVSMLVPTNNRITKHILCPLFTSGRDAFSKNAEQFSFRNVGDDSRSNISFRASLG